MKKNKNYPITITTVTDHPDQLTDIFLSVKPHKGAYIGVSLLDGCFMCDSPEELYTSLEIGELLTLERDVPDKLAVTPLSVFRRDRTLLGMLPHSASVLPTMLVSRGIEVFAYVEAKSFVGGLLSVAVSLYSEKY